MTLRPAAWASTLILAMLAVSCTKNTPGNTPSSQAQPATESTPQSSPASAAGEESKAVATPEKAPALKERAPAPKQATTEKKVPEQEAVTQAPPPTPPPPVVLPAGTKLNVRINDAVSAKNSKPGDAFTGSIAQPVVVQGRTVIPSGSPVSGEVVAAQQGGKVKGESSLTLHVTQVRAYGVAYNVSTDQFVQQAKGKGGRTTKMGAGGAAAGALIGGLAGGGKGAAIGAGVGAGAGVAGSAFTGNKELSIPAEAVLQFPLTQPVQIQIPAHKTNAPPAGDEEKK